MTPYVYMYLRHRGFIALVLMLTLSTIMITWVSLSSSYVFDFIRSKNKFETSRNLVTDLMACADSVIDHEVKRQFLNISEDYSLRTYWYTETSLTCVVSGRSIVEVSASEHVLRFTVHISGGTTSLTVTAHRVSGFITTTTTRLYIP